jgi:hypothetical protein
VRVGISRERGRKGSSSGMWRREERGEEGLAGDKGMWWACEEEVVGKETNGRGGSAAGNRWSDDRWWD